jgi:hypothetical protein
VNSRSKGKRGELEAAQAWRALIGSARRGQQFHGGPDSPDLVVMEGIHVEVKRVEQGNPYGWMDQAVTDAGSSVPLVLHRRNKKPWLAIVRLEDLPRLAALLGEANGRSVPDGVRGAAQSPGQEEDVLRVPETKPAGKCLGCARAGNCAVGVSGRQNRRKNPPTVRPDRSNRCQGDDT